MKIPLPTGLLEIHFFRKQTINPTSDTEIVTMEIIAITIVSLLILGMLTGIAVLLAYKLSERDIFFTRVPEGEIIVVTYSERVGKYIGNISDYWIHPKSGKVSFGYPPANVSMPTDIFGSGIYWLGLSPIAKRYSYMFHWDKYAKNVDSVTGNETAEYTIVPRRERVDSVYLRAQYAVQVSGAENSDGLPGTYFLNITVEMVDVGTALFKIKSPGWLSALTGQVTAVMRDFVGTQTLESINRMKAEIPDGKTVSTSVGPRKSAFQAEFLKLNDSTVGNPSIESNYGVKIIAVSFLGYKIDTVGGNPAQTASIAKWTAEKAGEAAIATARKAKIAAESESEIIRIKAEGSAKATELTGNAEAEVIVSKGRAEAEAFYSMGRAKADAVVLAGKAEAEAAEITGEKVAAAAAKLTEAVSTNPHYGAIVLAAAIQNQKTATTLVIGQGAVPTVEVGGKK
ncbi:MAG: hypothetical protein RLZZ67_684 [Candidatus Parcubacteria bacterium]|jgi:hypothetical protein